VKIVSLEKWLNDAKKDGLVNDTPSIESHEGEVMEVSEGSSPSKTNVQAMLQALKIEKPIGLKMIRATKGKSTLKNLMQKFPCCNKWLRGKPDSTGKHYACGLLDCCIAMNMLPTEYGELCKKDLDRARDLVWEHIEEISLNPDSFHKALNMLKAVKSFCRSYTKGHKLPFDSQKGGPHRLKGNKHREKFRFGTIDQTREILFRLIDNAHCLRDETIITLDLNTGMRANCFESLKWKDFKHVIKIGDKELIVLKITDQIDQKLQEANIDFYYSFVTNHALTTFRKYEQTHRGKQTDDDYVFYNNAMKVIKVHSVSCIFKRLVDRLVERTVIEKDPKVKLSFHDIRRAFRKFVRNSPIQDDDFKEFIMGHVLKGSREAYAERDPLELGKEYLKIDFEPPIESLKRKFKVLLMKKEAEGLIDRKDGTMLRKRLAKDISDLEQPTSPPIVQPTVQPTPLEIAEEPQLPTTLQIEQATDEFVLGPPPKHCLRNIAFNPTYVRDNSYCRVCKKTHLAEYRACMELREENPELFI